MGVRAHRFAGQHYLLTRQLREYLALMVGLLHDGDDRIEVGPAAFTVDVRAAGGASASAAVGGR
jgi:trehalose synthase